MVSRITYYPQRPSELSPKWVEQAYQPIVTRLKEAESAADEKVWLELYGRWNELRRFHATFYSKTSHASNADMRNEANEAKVKYLNDHISPVAQKFDSEIIGAFIATRHRPALEKRLGKQLFCALEVDIKPLHPINSDLRIQESQRGMDYGKLVASAQIDWNGEKLTVQRVSAFAVSPDPAVRKAAFVKVREWFAAHRKELAEIYGDLVRIRTQMAKNLGDPNFISLGYLRMGRTDYGPREAQGFRDGILKYVVPLQTEMHQALARVHGTPELTLWDSSYDPETTLPMGISPIAGQLDRAQKIFEQISPRLSGHFSMMRERELIDLENRPGKRAGAYCTSFVDEGVPAILCNSVGNASDVGTLMHEMGHAFQVAESLAAIESIDLLSPTLDACEIHSMGMEYISLNYMQEYFSKEDAIKFRQDRYGNAVELLCYVAIVDEFQHWIYENPSESIDARDQAWMRIWKKYKPSISFGDREDLAPMRWYQQGHIFGAPFYYIDYAIAEIGALQLGMKYQKDSKSTITTYIDLCRWGGTKSVLEIFKDAGLDSPFEPQTMSGLMQHARKELGL